MSGGGRSLENICQRIDVGTLTCCSVSLVIASKKTAGAIEKAGRRAIPTSVLRLRDFERDTAQFNDVISNVLDEYNIDFVVLKSEPVSASRLFNGMDKVTVIRCGFLQHKS